MGCAASRTDQGQSSRQGYWYDREENLITVNFTDSEAESDTRQSGHGSDFSSDYESVALESLPKDVPEKAAKVLLDPENRLDSGIWVDNISITEYDPEDFPVFEDHGLPLNRTRSQSLTMVRERLLDKTDDEEERRGSQGSASHHQYSHSYSGETLNTSYHDKWSKS